MENPLRKLDNRQQQQQQIHRHLSHNAGQHTQPTEEECMISEYQILRCVRRKKHINRKENALLSSCIGDFVDAPELPDVMVFLLPQDEAPSLSASPVLAPEEVLVREGEPTRELLLVHAPPQPPPPAPGHATQLRLPIPLHGSDLLRRGRRRLRRGVSQTFVFSRSLPCLLRRFCGLPRLRALPLLRPPLGFAGNLREDLVIWRALSFHLRFYS
ncbi:unnamed protein product, partial [Musa acuminata var. zebrina]